MVLEYIHNYIRLLSVTIICVVIVVWMYKETSEYMVRKKKTIKKQQLKKLQKARRAVDETLLVLNEIIMEQKELRGGKIELITLTEQHAISSLLYLIQPQNNMKMLFETYNYKQEKGENRRLLFPINRKDGNIK